jgi:hypothetical protein
VVALKLKKNGVSVGQEIPEPAQVESTTRTPAFEWGEEESQNPAVGEGVQMPDGGVRE